VAIYKNAVFLAPIFSNLLLIFMKTQVIIFTKDGNWSLRRMFNHTGYIREGQKKQGETEND
jgi:hypothetical protein